MEQTEFETLFEEASNELETELNEHLKSSHENLPEIDEVWELEYEGNIVGLLNKINTELDPENTENQLKNAGKSLILGAEAGSFDESTQEEVEDEIEKIKTTVQTINEINEHISKLIPLLPELKNDLDDLQPYAEQTFKDTNETTTEDPPETTKQNGIQHGHTGK